jgi:3-hydroxyisobutyrate dehydrogenase-like beta-hydroxyacid dehydrogenase
VGSRVQHPQHTCSRNPGTIIVDTSSSSPFDTQFLGRDLAAHNLLLVDAPITQTYMHATDAGESTLIVGADSPEIFNSVKPVLKAMVAYLFHMGPLGAGHAMKTLNNYIMASSHLRAERQPRDRREVGPRPANDARRAECRD